MREGARVVHSRGRDERDLPEEIYVSMRKKMCRKPKKILAKGSSGRGVHVLVQDVNDDVEGEPGLDQAVHLFEPECEIDRGDHVERSEGASHCTKSKDAMRRLMGSGARKMHRVCGAGSMKWMVMASSISTENFWVVSDLRVQVMVSAPKKSIGKRPKPSTCSQRVLLSTG